VLSVRLSHDATEIQTTAEVQTASEASSVKEASVVSQVLTASDESRKEASVVSQVLTASDESRSVQQQSAVPSESARTAADSSAIDSPLSSVCTSPALPQEHSTVESRQQPSIGDQGLFSDWCFFLFAW